MIRDSVDTLARHRFVALTTFKRSGEGVLTAMWIARDGAGLFVWTPAESGKVKRLRNDSRVLVAPSGRTGKVRAGVVPVEGIAEVVTDPPTVHRLERVMRDKYGLEFRVVTTIERLMSGGRKPRVIVRIRLRD